MAFFSIEPFGYERSDLAAAMICDTFVKATLGKRAKTAPIDFAPYIKQFHKNPSARDVLMASLGHLVRK